MDCGMAGGDLGARASPAPGAAGAGVTSHGDTEVVAVADGGLCSCPRQGHPAGPLPVLTLAWGTFPGVPGASAVCHS